MSYGNALAAYAAAQFIGCLLVVLAVGLFIGGAIIWLVK